MNRNQLTEFYSLKSCDEQEQVDCFFVQAMNLSVEGDAIMAAEMLVKAAEIITGRIETEKAYKRTTQEMERFVADVDAICVGNGGLYD